MSVISLLRRGALALAAGLLASTAAFAQSGPLVTTEWLEKNLSDPKVRIVEVSVEPGVYERGHIPGAQNVVWHTDLVETVSRDIAGPENTMQMMMRAVVISPPFSLQSRVEFFPAPAIPRTPPDHAPHLRSADLGPRMTQIIQMARLPGNKVLR